MMTDFVDKLTGSIIIVLLLATAIGIALGIDRVMGEMGTGLDSGDWMMGLGASVLLLVICGAMMLFSIWGFMDILGIL
jgi:uncharacterized membrane protein